MHGLYESFGILLYIIDQNDDTPWDQYHQNEIIYHKFKMFT